MLRSVLNSNLTFTELAAIIFCIAFIHEVILACNGQACSGDTIVSLVNLAAFCYFKREPQGCPVNSKLIVHKTMLTVPT